jgi:hypothetical protein
MVTGQIGHCKIITPDVHLISSVFDFMVAEGHEQVAIAMGVTL